MDRRCFLLHSSLAAASTVSFGLRPGAASGLNLLIPKYSNLSDRSNLSSDELVARAAWDLLPAHPRLFANLARFSAVEMQNDSVSRQLRALISAEAAKAFAAPEIDYAAPGISVRADAMHEAQSRVLYLAFSFRLSGERRYFERARKELLQLAALSDWHPEHFLDTSEAALTAGIGFDWLYDEFSLEDRDRIARAIVANALVPSLEPKWNNHWVEGDFNWNQVCNGGLTVGALAIAEREPELARRIVERAIRNIPKVSAAYAPDGSYPEGPGYWNYGTSFQLLCVEALRSALGSAFGLDRTPGFLESAEFKRQMVGPTGESFNFSDAHEGRADEPIMLWFARELKNRDLAENELERITNMYETLTAGEASRPGQRVRTDYHSMFGLLWWNPSLRSSGTSAPLHWTASGVTPIAAMRSAWSDSRATYVAIKGGTPNHSHAHMDVGSFVLEANGIRWALDLSAESYDRIRAANLTIWNYTQDSTRWSTFRDGPEGHNILRFNGARQQVDGSAGISALPDENGSMGNLVDLTLLYRDQVALVQRRIQLNVDRSVTIRDEWTAGDRGTEVTWQWLTRANAKATRDGFVLQQAGTELQLRVTSNAQLAYSIEDVSKPRNNFDSPNPGVSRLIIRLQTRPRETSWLSVTATPSS